MSVKFVNLSFESNWVYKKFTIKFAPFENNPLTKAAANGIIFNVILVHTLKCGRNPRGGAYKWQKLTKPMKQW